MLFHREKKHWETYLYYLSFTLFCKHQLFILFTKLPLRENILHLIQIIFHMTNWDVLLVLRSLLIYGEQLVFKTQYAQIKVTQSCCFKNPHTLVLCGFMILKGWDKFILQRWTMTDYRHSPRAASNMRWMYYHYYYYYYYWCCYCHYSALPSTNNISNFLT